jgi:protein SCO1/2
MAKPKNISLLHAIFAMVVLATLASFPLWFYEPKMLEDPLAGLPEKASDYDKIPIELRGVGITENIGAELPLNLVFKDETGADVALGSFFKPGRPVILTLNYSDCPMLCHVQLHNFVECMNKGKIFPGQQFAIVTVSIDPNQSPSQSKLGKQSYSQQVDGLIDEWHFLVTRKEESIKTLARIVGFNYKYDPVRKDYAHSSTLIFCTPDGSVSQYYQGIKYEPDELRKRLADAAGGKQYASGTLENYFNCKVYDGSKPYALTASRVMKVVCTICAIAVILVLTILWMLPRKQPDVLPLLSQRKETLHDTNEGEKRP